ncbi:hypothetical protein L2E82_32808 [Cichorium intybus]|uniref:Uncharacterized protein n=1 Tax=Cichorium intybus TaxID=13427 RepID=A0ACB9BHT7_CICIN|nr:hypothetical protein L2E82_32808 [Cichorium intybus]
MLGRLSTRISLGGAYSTVCLLLPLLACLDIAFLLLIRYLISSVLHYNKHLIGTIYKDKACPLGNLDIKLLIDVLKELKSIVFCLARQNLFGAGGKDFFRSKLHNMSRGYKHEEAAASTNHRRGFFFNSFNTTTDVSSKKCSVGDDLDHYAHYADAFIHSSSSHNSFNSFLEPPSYAEAVFRSFDGEKSGLTIHGYDVSKYIYAMSQYEIPRWLEKPYMTDTWSKDSNWMDYVAVSDDLESKRI